MTLVDWAVIAILAIAFFSGLAQGFFRSICGLGGLILGLAVAAWNYHHLAAILDRFIRVEAASDAVAFALILIVVILVTGLIGNVLAKTFKLIGLGWLDALAGGAFGLLQGALLVTILILVTVAFFPQTRWIADARLPQDFFGAAHLGSNITPAQLGDRIREGLRQWERESPKWLHPTQN
jgi:membrane protein required for colicin V production